MSGIALIHGTVRQITPKVKRATGEVFGKEVSILTELGAELGETVRVLVFNPRGAEVGPRLEVDRTVSWVCEIDGNNFGLSATFRHEATTSELEQIAGPALVAQNFPAPSSTDFEPVPA